MHTLAIKTDGTLWGWGHDSDYELGLLTLVRAAPGLHRALPPPGPDRRLPEVVQPGAAPRTRGVERLLGIARVAAGDVVDRAGRAVLETHRGVHIALFRAAERGLPSDLSSYSGPAKLQLVRDAGTLNLEGQLRDGHGTGFFTLAAWR